MTERPLAYIVKVDDVVKHTNGDNLDIVHIKGWQCVAEKDTIKKDDLVVYFEIDSLIPHNIAPYLSKGKPPRNYMGIDGERLRTIKLRGELSQGLVVPVGKFSIDTPTAGKNVTDILGIKKYDGGSKDTNNDTVEMNRNRLPGFVKKFIYKYFRPNGDRHFPECISKTDQPRIQGMFDKLVDGEYEISEKLDGSSMTVYYSNGHLGVCSRNYEKANPNINWFQKLFFKTPTSNFWECVKFHKIDEAISNFCRINGRNLAFQGELIGNKIQGNSYNINGYAFYVFDIYDIDRKEYLNSKDRRSMVKYLGLNHVPCNEPRVVKFTDINTLLKLAEFKSVLNIKAEAEGHVYKNINDPSISFKVISNKFLLNEKDC